MLSKYSSAFILSFLTFSAASKNTSERKLPPIPVNICQAEIGACDDDPVCKSCYDNGVFPEKDGAFGTCDDLMAWMSGIQYDDIVACDYTANPLLANIVYCMFDNYAYEGDLECVPEEPEACSVQKNLCMNDPNCVNCYNTTTFPAKNAAFGTCAQLNNWLDAIEIQDYINCDFNANNDLLGQYVYCLYDTYAVEGGINNCVPDTSSNTCAADIQRCMADETCKACYEEGTFPEKDSVFETCDDLVDWLSGVTFDDLITCDYNVQNPLLSAVIYCLHDSYAVEDGLTDCVVGLTPINPTTTNAPTMAPTMMPTMAPTVAPTLQMTMVHMDN